MEMVFTTLLTLQIYDWINMVTVIQIMLAKHLHNKAHQSNDPKLYLKRRCCNRICWIPFAIIINLLNIGEILTRYMSKVDENAEDEYQLTYLAVRSFHLVLLVIIFIASVALFFLMRRLSFFENQISRYSMFFFFFFISYVYLSLCWKGLEFPSEFLMKPNLVGNARFEWLYK